MEVQRIRDYELMLVLTPEASEDEAAAIVERVVSLITERDGSVSDPQRLGVRRLAYPIQRFQEGNYVLIRFELDSRNILEIDQSLIASQDVLRHLLTKVDEKVKRS